MDLSNVTWRKSSYSSASGCVEVTGADSQVAIRHSKDPEGPILIFTAVQWQAFLDGVRQGEFDQPSSA
jgi:predicted secreted Zn-dependent protease